MARIIASLMFVSVIASGLLLGQELPEYSGILSPSAQANPSFPWNPQYLFAVTDEQAGKIGLELSPGQKAFIGKLRLDSTVEPLVILIEDEESGPTVFVDCDMDGALTDEEHFEFQPYDNQAKEKPTVTAPDGGSRSNDKHEYRVEVQLRLKNRRIRSFPVLVWRFQPPQEKFASVMCTNWADVDGTAEVQGKSIAVRMRAKADGEISREWLGIDANGDGSFDRSRNSVEWAYLWDDEQFLVFKVSDKYLSLKQVDSVTGQFALKEHPPSDYIWIDLHPGNRVDDFQFEDLLGKPHNLSDYSGKGILLFFWESDSKGSLKEIPRISEICDRYSQSLQVIGISGDDSTELVKEFDSKSTLPWLQARPESTRTLIRKRLRLSTSTFPAFLLLSPDRTILATGPTNELGEALSKHLKQ